LSSAHPDRGTSREASVPRDARHQWLAASVIAGLASVPVAPAAFLALAIALGPWFLRHGRVRRAEAVALVALAALGCLAQFGSASWVRSPLGVDASALGSAGDEPRNLVANSDLSWLRGWSRSTGATAYAQPVEPGFWRLEAVDTSSGARHTELVTANEVATQPDTAYTMSIVVRHDGSSFDGQLMFRTRLGRVTPGTDVEPVGPGSLRLTATLEPQTQATRLRVLHLVGLGGDWTWLDVGFVQLTPGTDAVSYRPRWGIAPWYRGMLWWLGLSLALLVSAVVARAVFWLVGRGVVAGGLLLGIGIQALVVAGQLATSGGGGRAAGTMGDPNTLAHVIVVAALAVAVISRRPSRDGTLALALATAVVIASGSHAGLVGLLLGTAVLAGPALLRIRGRRSFVLAAGLALAAAAVVAVAGMARPGAVTGDDQNLRARVQVWGIAWRLAAEHPLTGVGHDNVAHHYEFAVPPEAGPRYRNAHAHNALLHLAASFGWPVSAAFTLALVAMLRLLLAARATTTVVLFAVALLLNLVDLTLFHSALFLPLWLAYCAVTPTHPVGTPPRAAHAG
jgi:hypothetical protein